jgi:hypothetical protein
MILLQIGIGSKPPSMIVLRPLPCVNDSGSEALQILKDKIDEFDLAKIDQDMW